MSPARDDGGGHATSRRLWALDLLWVSSVVAVYLLTARLSLRLVLHPEGIAAVWPPEGIFLSAILLSRPALRLPIAIVLLVTDFIAELLTGTSVALGGLYAFALAGDAVLSAWLLRRFLGEPITFGKVREVIGFLVLAVGLSNGLWSLVAAAASRSLPGASFWSSWALWAISNGMGNVLVTPFLVSWATGKTTSDGLETPKRIIEAVLLLSGVVVVNVLTFDHLAHSRLIGLLLPYVTSPFLLWAAFRLGVRGLTTTLALLAIVIMVPAATSDAFTAASFHGGRLDTVVTAQLYLAVMAIPSLLLAAVIAERRHVGLVLRESEHRYRAIFENSPIAVWEGDFSALKRRFDELRRGGVTDLGAYLGAHRDEVVALVRGVRPLKINQAGVEAFGVAGEDQFFRRFPPDLTDDAFEPFEKVVIALAEGRTRIHAELPIRRDDGRALLFDVTLSVQPGDEHTLGRVLLSMVSITEERRAQRELRDRNRMIETILEHAPIGFAVNVVSTGLGVFVSRRFDEIYGVPPGSMTSVDDYFERVYLDPAFREQIRSRMMADIASADASRMRWEDIPITTAAGERRFVTAINIPLFNQDLMVSTVQDVTARHVAEEEQQKLQMQFLQAQKMESVGRLAGGVAHDFNNMLTVIAGNTELALLEADPNKELAACLNEIRMAAERSAALTRQLLAFARKQTVEPRVVDLNDLVGDMLKILRRLIGEQVDLEWRPSPELWKVRLDPAQVDQLLANLCVNARDAIPSVGRIVIETDNVSLTETYCADHLGCVPGQYVRMTVSDTGSGMEQEVLDHLFEPFFTTKGRGHGTGLGLATVYGIVKQNQGSINVYSEPGRGTTFRIYLPRWVGDPAVDNVPPPADSVPLARGETILVAEDDPSILSLASNMLTRLGYEVITALSPDEAIRQADEYPAEIGLLLTDVIMPAMDGRQLAELIGARRPNLKCLFMSGYTADVISHHGIVDEGVRFISKPFTVGDLARKVRAALDSEPARRNG